MFWDIVIGSALVLFGLQMLLSTVFKVKVPLLQIGIAVLLIVGGVSMLIDQKPFKHFISKIESKK